MDVVTLAMAVVQRAAELPAVRWAAAVAAILATSYMLLAMRPRRKSADHPELLPTLVDPRTIVDAGRAQLALVAAQAGPRVRLVLIVHHQRDRAEHLRLTLAAGRGRRCLGSRLPRLSVELPPAAMVMLRLDLVLRKFAKPRRLAVGLASTVRFSEVRSVGRHRTSRWPTIRRLRLTLARWQWGRAAVVKLPLQPVPDDQWLDPLEHWPDWEYYTLWTPAEPRDLDFMRQRLETALNG